MLNLDLTLLREPKRFEHMCFRLARYEFPDVVPLAQSWDGGRDLIVFGQAHNGNGDVVFQCKVIKNLIRAKATITESLDALAKSGRRSLSETGSGVKTLEFRHNSIPMKVGLLPMA